MVLSQFKSTLERQGVATIEAQNKPFDPNFHEAISQETSEHPQGTIIQEQVRGYMLHGRLLSPSRVVVSQGQGAT